MCINKTVFRPVDVIAVYVLCVHWAWWMEARWSALVFLPLLGMAAWFVLVNHLANTVARTTRLTGGTRPRWVWRMAVTTQVAWFTAIAYALLVVLSIGDGQLETPLGPALITFAAIAKITFTLIHERTLVSHAEPAQQGSALEIQVRQDDARGSAT